MVEEISKWGRGGGEGYTIVVVIVCGTCGGLGISKQGGKGAGAYPVVVLVCSTWVGD